MPSPLALILMDTSYLRNLKWSFLVRKYFEGLHSMVKIKMTLVKRHLMIHLLLNCTQAHMKGGALVLLPPTGIYGQMLMSGVVENKKACPHLQRVFTP